MCLILFAVEAHPTFPLIVASNRDESYARPAAPAAFWTDHPDVLAGQDIDHGGTWLGITRDGRWAALTNVRQGGSYRSDAPSRGALVGEFLKSRVDPGQYLQDVESRGAAYNGFNLIVADLTRVWYVSNRSGAPLVVGRGIHGLSNHLLNTPWPKVVNGRHALEAITTHDAGIARESLFAVLADRHAAEARSLPDTGIGRNREKALSPTFIAADTYGTRASTVLLVDLAGHVSFTERTFGPRGVQVGTVHHEFVLDERAKKFIARC